MALIAQIDERNLSTCRENWWSIKRGGCCWLFCWNAGDKAWWANSECVAQAQFSRHEATIIDRAPICAVKGWIYIVLYSTV